MSHFLDHLPSKYSYILSDLWGCVHNGVEILPGVVERLDRWIDEGRTVVFLTNAPRPSHSVRDQLERLGLPARLIGTIVSSGDAALAWIDSHPSSRTFSFIGSEKDRLALENSGISIADGSQADAVICCGFDERGFNLADYEDELRQLAAAGRELLCLNPDRLVHRGGTPELCAGAIAEAFRDMGGSVRHFGKPYRAIYDHALQRIESIGQPVALGHVLAIGDSIATDYVGAVNAGIDFVFVISGIDEERYRKQGYQSFAQAPGLNCNRQPIATVEELGIPVMEHWGS